MNLKIPRWLLIALGCLLALVAAIAITLQFYPPLTRNWVEKTLEKRYASKVEIGGFHASIFPPSAVAENLVFRLHGRTDVPPFVTIKRLTIQAGYLELLRSPRHLSHVRLEGLQIQIPPRDREHKRPNTAKARKDEEDHTAFVVNELIADGTELNILPRDAGKEPKHFEIRRLTLHSVGKDRPMTFVSTLTNAKPPGDIQSNGEFGPWHKEEPGDTPVSGKYTFRDAKLDVFKGIAGTLSSDGRYKGTLNRIEVDGTTDTPDFQVTESGNRVDLKTQFHSVVDGTDGDTLLQPVKSNFLHSVVLAEGGVEGKPGVKGKTVSLNVHVRDSRIDDLLRLAVRGKPPMTGAVNFDARLIIPPGPRDIIDKLQLYGDFGIGAARFANLNVEQKVTILSQRARGQTDGDPAESVLSNLRGHFTLKNGMVSFTSLSFGVPGAQIQLAGTYRIRSEELNFRGIARLQAKPSQMMTGYKSLLLKAIDPFFRKRGATEIPIKITGTKSQPSFGLAWRR